MELRSIVAAAGFAALMFLSLTTGIAWADEGNLLKNADFEKGLSEWRQSGKAWSVQDGAGYNGSKGLVWTNDDPTFRAYPAQYVEVEPGSAYRMRALVKVDELKAPKGWRPRVGFEWFDKSGKWQGGASAVPVDDNGILKDGWTQYEGMTRVMPADAARGGFLCLLAKGCTGKVRFDNVSFERVPVKPIEFIVTSAYRDTAADGKLRVMASLHANPAKQVIQLAYANAQGGWSKSQPSKFDADKAVFELDVASLAKGTQLLLVTIRNVQDGSVAGSGTVSFTRCDKPRARRVTFDAQRRMYLDGKPFFPLGHYVGRMTDEDIAEYKRGPHNFVIQYGGATAAELDRWQKAGVYVAPDVRGLIYGYNYSAKSGLKTIEDSKVAFRKLYGEIGSHPALVMWYLNDEAPVQFVPNTTAVNEFLHELDPEHATVTCLCAPRTVGAFLPSYDVMAHDCYPIGNHVGKNMMERVTRQMREVEDDMQAMRPLWFIPQTFDWKWCYRGDSLKRCDQEYLRMPTREEMACMTWQGIACGANGIVSYSFSTIRKYAKGDAYEKAWSDTCAVAEEVKKMETVLLADGLPVETAGLPTYVVARAWRHAGSDWYLVVNAMREPQKATVPLATPGAKLATALGRGVTLAPDGRSLVCDFGPMDYAFVEIKR